MSNPEIKDFAKMLIEQVRDAAIRHSDMRLQPHVNDPAAKRWRVAVRGTSDEFAKEVISDVVDETLCCLLRAIDEGGLKLSFSAPNGKTVDLTADGQGELEGWYAGGEWLGMYAKERFVDDFSDLDNFFSKPPL